jgi:hypothetical protein
VLTERAGDKSSRIIEVEAYGTDAPPNTPPTIELTAPASGAEFTAPATILITADASDGDGIRDVMFYASGLLIGTDSDAPYSIDWENPAAGNYALAGIATDMFGGTTTSSIVNIAVIGGGPARINVASSLNGAAATASSTVSAGYSAAATINGDRRGVKWGAGGGWKDATPGSFPDWLEVAFAGPKTIDEVDVFSMQDGYKTPAEPTPMMTFSAYGLIDFTIQYWDGADWQTVPNGTVRGNTLVWHRIVFPPLTTSRIRVLSERAGDGSTRIIEVEAYGN